ncbi:MAG: hypothetical protein ACK5B4_00900 [Bacteroidota bacterium]|jgi:REP element-mobilizing transposase RayT
MSVRKLILEKNGVFFITFTCFKWLKLYQYTNGYAAVYKWFDVLKTKGHHIVAYVIMPSHLHVIIAFKNSNTPINTIIGNGKRFLAYELVSYLEKKELQDILLEMQKNISKNDKKKYKKHEVFQPSFDWKECYNIHVLKQKADYIHFNPCKAGLSFCPENYLHSSAKYYYTGVQGVYPVITYIELQDVDLS